MSDLQEPLEAMQLNYLAYYASGRTTELPESDFRSLRNVATQITVTGGEISEEGKELIQREESR